MPFPEAFHRQEHDPGGCNQEALFEYGSGCNRAHAICCPGWLATDYLFKNSGAATKSRVVSTTKVATPCAVLRRLTEVARRPAACAALPNGQEFDCVQTTAEQFHAVSECYAMCQVVGKITTLALTMQFMLPGWVSVSATAFPGEGAGLRSSELVVPNRGYGCPDCRPASQLCGEAPSVYDRDRQGARDLATSSPGSCSSVWT